MSLNQVNEQFNDAFETYFPKLNPLARFLHLASTASLSAGLKLRTRLFGGRLVVNERIVEYPQILRWLQPQGVILDIGCVSSRLPIQLASLGYQVHGVDVRPYRFTHPLFTFHQVDLFRWTPPRTFDTVLLVSTLEHFGIGGYGDLQLGDADHKAVERITDWLIPGGQLLVSVPFGKAAITPKHRIYDSSRLVQIFQRFTWVEAAYYQRANGAWLPSNVEELSTVESPDLPPNGVAILHLRRKESEART